MFSASLKVTLAIEEDGSEAHLVRYIKDDDTVGELILEGNPSSVTLEIRRGRVNPVLVYPLEDRNIVGKPLGAVYPYNDMVTEKNGFAAFIAWSVFCLADGDPGAVHEYISYFNWEKLEEDLEEYGNPWELDCEAIIKNIADGTFRKTDLKYADK